MACPVVSIDSESDVQCCVVVHDSDSDIECLDDSPAVLPLPKKMRRRRSCIAGCELGVSPKEYRRLKRMHAPRLLLFLMHALIICNDGIPQDIDVAEMFSGVGHLVSAAKAAGMAALTYEILEDKIHQDICSPQGFLEALLMMMRLHLQGLVHWDTCCSNWIWMSRSGTGRNNANPMGDPSLSKVQIANLMVSRMCCLQLVAFAKYGIMILEQPASSLMPKHQRMQEPPFSSMCRMFLHMGSYGSPSAKPSILLSNEMLVTLPIRRPMTPEQKAKVDGSHLVKVEYKSDGSKIITGVPGMDGLKGSQEYTMEYAEAVIGSYQNWKQLHAPNVLLQESSDSDYSDTEGDSWDDALLKPCAAQFTNLNAARTF